MTYRVDVSDPADAEAEEAVLWLARRVSPEYAGRWYAGLLRALRGLSAFPTRHPPARENDRYDVQVRRMLYFGPGKRRSGTPYRVLFHVIEPSGGEGEGVVRVLHVYHGAQQAGGPDEDPQDD